MAYDTPSGFTIGPPFALADFNGDNKPDIVTTTRVRTLALHAHWQWRGNLRAGRTKASRPPTRVQPATGPRRGTDQRHRQRRYPGNYDEERNEHGQRAGDVAVFLGNGNDTFGSEMDTPSIRRLPRWSPATSTMTMCWTLSWAARSAPIRRQPCLGRGLLSRGEEQRLIRPARADRHSAQSRLIRRRRAHQRQEPGPGSGQRGTPFATTPVDGSVLVYLGNGNGTFQSPKTLSAPAFPQAVAIADVNDDGHPDIVVLSEFSGQSFQSRVWVFLGDGAGNFGTGMRPRSTNTPTAAGRTSTATAFPTSRSRVAAALPTPKCGPAMATELSPVPLNCRLEFHRAFRYWPISTATISSTCWWRPAMRLKRC